MSTNYDTKLIMKYLRELGDRCNAKELCGDAVGYIQYAETRIAELEAELTGKRLECMALNELRIKHEAERKGKVMVDVESYNWICKFVAARTGFNSILYDKFLAAKEAK